MPRAPLATPIAAAILLFSSPAPAAEPPAPPENAPDPARQFDFWCGTWSIDNERLLRTGEHESGHATLTVRPILDGAAILEQGWEGSPEGDMKDIFGMSLRYYDAELRRWVVILCWPAGPPISARFARMEGAFTESDTGPTCTLYPPASFDAPGFDPKDRFPNRFIFSEPTPTSLRWTLEVPFENRVITVWDMRFTRTADALPADTPLTIKEPPEHCACNQPEARDLDWLVGTWTAQVIPHSDNPNAGIAAPQTVTLRASSATRGCTTFLSVERDGAQERFAVLAYNPDDHNWQAHSLDAQTRHAAWRGAWENDSASLALTAAGVSHPDRVGQSLHLARDGNDKLTLAIRPSDPDAPAILEATFTRVAP